MQLVLCGNLRIKRSFKTFGRTYCADIQNNLFSLLLSKCPSGALKEFLAIALMCHSASTLVRRYLIKLSLYTIKGL